MPSFLSTETAVANATAVKVVDAADFNRVVVINDSTGSSMRIAFTSADASTGMKVNMFEIYSGQPTARFVLPAAQELWVWQNSGNSATATVLVTATG